MLNTIIDKSSMKMNSTKKPNAKKLELQVLHGPENTAGMASVIARWQRKSDVNATSICLPSKFSYEPDYLLAQRTENSISFSNFYLRELLKYDVYHFYYDRTYFGQSFAEMQILKRFGKKVFLTFLGCDIRDADYEIANNSNSMCAACQRNGCSPNRKKLLNAARHADHVFVTTPDLLPLIPDATWLPLTTDIDLLQSAQGLAPAPYRKGEVLKVFHAPTDKVKKGSDFVYSAIEGLRKEGYEIEVFPSDHHHQESLWKIASQCHVSIDQLLSGVYGTTSVELLAIGIPVICFLDSRYWARDQMDPFISTTPSELTACLRQILTGSIDLRSKAEQGKAYFNAVHHPKKVAEIASSFY